MNKRRILVVDDDTDLRHTLVEQLEGEPDFDIIQAGTANDALKAVRENNVDLTILDVGLPDMDGRDAIKLMRQEGYKSPVLMLTGHDTDADEIKGLESGPNDYLTKPFAFPELSARVEALIRWSQPQQPVAEVRELHMADLKINLLTRSAERAGQPLALQPREFRLLAYLMTHAEQILTRTMLLEGVWDYHFDPGTNVIDVHVSRLRKKIDMPGLPPLLYTVRGSGYRLGTEG